MIAPVSLEWGMACCLFSDRRAGFFEERCLPDHIGLATLPAFRADVVRIRVATAVGTEICLGLDKRARVGDHVDDALVEAFGRNWLGEKLRDAGVTRRGH